jgi:hypothetical protein
MGMYDDIVCKYSLPYPEDTKGYTVQGFQTKDLDCVLNFYEIREDGTLWLRECEREYIYDDNNDKTFFVRLPKVKEVRHWWTQLKITQTIRIYNYQRGDGQYDYWIEFELIFVDGKVSNVKLVKFDANDNTQRKENENRHIEELKARTIFESTWYYKLFARPYNKLVKFVIKLLHKFGSFLMSIVWKLEKKLII